MKKRTLAILMLINGFLCIVLDFQAKITTMQKNDVLIKDLENKDQQYEKEKYPVILQDENLPSRTISPLMKEETKKTFKDSYIGYLEISKIHLKQGFYDYSSKENSVRKNIEVLSKTCNPTLACSFLLASHSGDSPISYFRDLDQLEIGDQASLYYEGKTYSYILKKIETCSKVGVFSLIKPSHSELVLTTCDEILNNQNIYFFEPVTL